MGRSRSRLFHSLTIGFCLSLFSATSYASSPILRILADHHRYSDILGLSLRHLDDSDQSCDRSCQGLWARNAARSVLFMGDFEGALLYLKFAQDTVPQESSTLDLRAYTALQARDMTLFQSYRDSLAVDSLSKARWTAIEYLAGPDEASSLARNKMMELEELKLLPEPQQESLGRYNRFPQKNSWIAGGLSALIPGSGLAYLGLYSSAFTSFILTGTSFVAASELYRNKQPAAAGAAALIGSVFYAGSIGASVRSSREVNRRQSLAERDILLQALMPSLKFEF